MLESIVKVEVKLRTIEMERLVSGILAFSEWFSDIICRSDTLPPLEEEHEIAAFGKPGEKDVKRMQMAIFGREPVVGRKWIVFVHLYDDTVMAFEVKKTHKSILQKTHFTP